MCVCVHVSVHVCWDGGHSITKAPPSLRDHVTILAQPPPLPATPRSLGICFQTAPMGGGAPVGQQTPLAPPPPRVPGRGPRGPRVSSAHASRVERAEQTERASPQRPRRTALEQPGPRPLRVGGAWGSTPPGQARSAGAPGPQTGPAQRPGRPPEGSTSHCSRTARSLQAARGMTHSGCRWGASAG